MFAIKAIFTDVGAGVCSLNGKETEGLTVSFENENACFLSWKAFRQLLTMKVTQRAKPEPTAPPVTNAVAAPKS